MTSIAAIDPKVFRAAMSRFCTGVVVVTGRHGERPLGMSLQSFVSLSLDPPLIAICPSRTSTSWPTMRDTGLFAINILAANQLEVCRGFARSGGDKFEGRPWQPSETLGMPALEGAMGIIECRLENEVAGGDHTIAIGRVMALHGFCDPIQRPLLFHGGGYGTFNGM